MGRKLSVGGFRGFAVLIFALLFAVHRHMYVMPDALSTAAGTMLGTYLFVWLIWWLVRWSMKDRAPDARFFLVVVSAVALVVTNLGNIGAMLR